MGGALGAAWPQLLTLSSPLGLLLPWRWLAVAGEGPVLVMILLLSFMPNSPRFLLSRGRDSEAMRALAWLRGADTDIRWEFEQIQDNVRRQVGKGWAPTARCGHGQFLGLSEPLLLFLENGDSIKQFPLPGTWNGGGCPYGGCLGTQRQAGVCFGLPSNARAWGLGRGPPGLSPGLSGLSVQVLSWRREEQNLLLSPLQSGQVGPASLSGRLLSPEQPHVVG